MRPLVIIPTYNERENVQRLVPQLLEIPGLRVLVVDDASLDGTGFAAEVLAEHSDGRVSVVHRIDGPRGLGHASLDGIRRALETDADVICQMDADLSHQSADLAVMLDAVRHADLVIGSRYVAGRHVVNRPLGRTILSAAANTYIRALFSIDVRDCTSRFRCWRRDVLASLPLHRIDSEGAAFSIELLYEALAIGCKASEVPITFVERARGQSKRHPGGVAEMAALPWKLALSRAFSRTASAAASVPAAGLRAVDSGPR
jgi:dolichol-phosphate mannosyltransferase